MLRIYFLNVGKGNCTIIDFPSNRLSMVDIDNSRIRDDDEVLTDPINYVNSNFKGRSIFRFILTHPDMDHMSGLDELADNFSILNFWDTDHDKTLTEEDWEGSPYNQSDWDRYLEFRKSSENPKCLRLLRGATSECCWVEDGIEILSPSSHLIEVSDNTPEDDPKKYHHLSYVLMMEYEGVRVLLGGDASVEAWKDILSEIGEESLKADIFLAPHHGSENNIHEEAFSAVKPDYVIVSVAKGVEYAYDYYSGLAGKGVLTTKYYGTIILHIDDDETYKFIVERNA